MPFALSFTPGSSPSKNSTSGGPKRVADKGFLVHRDRRLTGDTLGALDDQ
jgi:hypothetical protein